MFTLCLSCVQNTAITTPKTTTDSRLDERKDEVANETTTAKATNPETKEVRKLSVNKETTVPSVAQKEILEEAKDVVANQNSLATKSRQALESQPNCKNCASVALIASTTHHLKNDLPQASSFAEQAYTMSNDKIEFLPTSRTITTDQTLENQRQLAKAKDFIIAQRNKGMEDFKRGNVQFLGFAKYKDAIKHYKVALQKGLESEDLRKECTTNLAICLYHAKDMTRSKQLIVYAWLVDPNLQINVGEEATREALEQFIRDFQSMQK